MPPCLQRCGAPGSSADVTLAGHLVTPAHSEPASPQGSASSPLWGGTQLLKLWAFSSWRFKWFSPGLGFFQLFKSGFKRTEYPSLLHFSLHQPVHTKTGSWCCRSSSWRDFGCKSLHRPPVKRQKKKSRRVFATSSSPCSTPQCDVPATELSPRDKAPASTSRSCLCHSLDLQLHRRSGFGGHPWTKNRSKVLPQSWTL